MFRWIVRGLDLLSCAVRSGVTPERQVPRVYLTGRTACHTQRVCSYFDMVLDCPFAHG